MIAIEAIKKKKIINEIASHYGHHPQMVRAWKGEFLKNASKVFETIGETRELKNKT